MYQSILLGVASLWRNKVDRGEARVYHFGPNREYRKNEAAPNKILFVQTCASHGAGAEAAIHGMRELFEEEEAEAVLLIDASNAFNSMNRMVGLHNIRIQCPYLSKYLINTYRQQSRLFITGGAVVKLLQWRVQPKVIH